MREKSWLAGGGRAGGDGGCMNQEKINQEVSSYVFTNFAKKWNDWKRREEESEITKSTKTKRERERESARDVR